MKTYELIIADIGIKLRLLHPNAYDCDFSAATLHSYRCRIRIAPSPTPLVTPYRRRAYRGGRI